MSFKDIEHPAGRTLSSDWSTNSFIIVFVKFSQNFLSKGQLKYFLIDNYLVCVTSQKSVLFLQGVEISCDDNVIRTTICRLCSTKLAICKNQHKVLSKLYNIPPTQNFA